MSSDVDALACMVPPTSYSKPNTTGSCHLDYYLCAFLMLSSYRLNLSLIVGKFTVNFQNALKMHGSF